MAQSATKRTPLGIDPFWDKPTPDPPLRREKEGTVQTGTLDQRKHQFGHATRSKTRNGRATSKANLRRDNSGCICTIREGKERAQRAAKDELAKQMSTLN